MQLVRWLRERDPQGIALKRSARAAIVLPCSFGLAHVAFSDPQVSLFASFGSFAFLLLVEFRGRPLVRLESYLVLLATGACLVVLGTALSAHEVTAVVGMAVVGFLVLYAGIASQSVATASTATLLMFVLPVAVAAPWSETRARLLGLGIAGALCIPACLVVWPPLPRDDLRRRLSATITAIGRVVRAHAEGVPDTAARAALDAELASMRRQFAATPYPQAGGARGAVRLATLEARVEWAAANATFPREESLAREPSARAVLAAVADTLDRAAALVCDGHGDPVEDAASIRALRGAAAHLVTLIATELEAEASALSGRGGPDDARADGAVGAGSRAGHDQIEVLDVSLDPTFRARALVVATTMVVNAVLDAAGAAAVGGDRDGSEAVSQARSAARLLISHLTLRSVWFRNAVRGAAGLALAVTIVEVTNVEHGFWVVLGTLSVLRSSALGTGSTALRAVAGTAAGFVIGSAIMFGVSGHLVALWLLLPIAVFVAGTAPSMLSFAAGQAGFTVFVIILFNLIVPSGWRVGLTRVEDVAIGCAVSVVVGLLFWPRGATAALGRSLSDAFDADSRYLTDAVERLTLPVRGVDTASARQGAHLAHLRLNDAYRQFLAERSTRVVSVETAAGLFNGATRVRMAADTLASTPPVPLLEGRAELESVTVAGAVLRDAFASSHRWYVEFAELLADRRDALDAPPSSDETVRDVLQLAFDDARGLGRVDQTRVILGMLWADELLEAQRRIQLDLADAADAFADLRRGGRTVRDRRRSSGVAQRPAAS